MIITWIESQKGESIKMACDRFVCWAEVKPTKNEAESIIKNYLDEAATEIKWDKDRFFVTLVGKPSFPFKDIITSDPSVFSETRWLEVYLAQDNLDVITRMGDEYTNTVADGLANLFVRLYDAALEAG